MILFTDTDYEIIREGDRGVRKSDLKPMDGCGKIIGTAAICVKDDPDMRDPPGKHFLDQYLQNLKLSHIKTKWHKEKKFKKPRKLLLLYFESSS